MVKTSDGTDRFYIYGPTGLIAIGINSISGLAFVHKDHLGSTKLIVNSSGNMLCRYEYDPYGKVVNAQESPDPRYKFTGQELERDFSTTSFWNFRARQFDSEIGLFYAPDPAHQFWSSQGYVAGNPISFTDPTGKVLPDSKGGGWMPSGFYTAGMYSPTYSGGAGIGGGSGFVDASGNANWTESFEAGFARTWGTGWATALVAAGWTQPVGMSIEPEIAGTLNGLVDRVYAQMYANIAEDSRARAENSLANAGPMMAGDGKILEISVGAGGALLAQGINSNIGFAIDIDAGTAKFFMNQGPSGGLGGGLGLTILRKRDDLNSYNSFFVSAKDPQLSGATYSGRYGMFGIVSNLSFDKPGVGLSVGPLCM